MSRPEPEKSTDPLIEEIREVRRKISEELGNDIGRLCDHLRQIEDKEKSRLVHPRRPNP